MGQCVVAMAERGISLDGGILMTETMKKVIAAVESEPELYLHGTTKKNYDTIRQTIEYERNSLYGTRLAHYEKKLYVAAKEYVEAYEATNR